MRRLGQPFDLPCGSCLVYLAAIGNQPFPVRRQLKEAAVTPWRRGRGRIVRTWVKGRSCCCPEDLAPLILELSQQAFCLVDVGLSRQRPRTALEGRNDWLSRPSLCLA